MVLGCKAGALNRVPRGGPTLTRSRAGVKAGVQRYDPERVPLHLPADIDGLSPSAGRVPRPPAQTRSPSVFG